MAVTLKKIRNYALLGTIISANATAPAQATSLKNITDNEGLSKIPQNQVSISNKNTLAETDDSDNTHSCISVPEFELCNQFKNNDDEKSLNNSLLQKAKSSIESIRAGEAIKVKNSQRQVYMYPSLETTVAVKKPLLYSNIYTTDVSKQSKFSRQFEDGEKKKVPEPSALLGLIAFWFLAAKYQAAKNSQKSVV